MCVFTHIAAGALVGSLAPNVYYAPFFGLGSHVILDIVPHYDIDSIAGEIALAVIFVLVVVLIGAITPAISLGMAFAILPDLENLLWKKGKITEEQKKFPGHRGIIPHGREVGKKNIIFQVVFAISVFVFLYWKR